jgi:type VI secretion system protein ImpH
VKRTLSAWARLLREPRRFGFDAAMRLLMHRARSPDPAEAGRFRSIPRAAFERGEVVSVAERPDQSPEVGITLIGLLGGAGVMPRLYTELAGQRGRNVGLHAFIDLLAQRMVGAFAAAGTKYRLHRACETAALATPPLPDKASAALLALTGHGTPGLVERLRVEPETLQHYAGLLAMRPRSADRLAAMLSDWLGPPVVVEEFAGGWLALPKNEQSTLGRGLQAGAWSRLGVDAAIGVRSWDAQARIILRIGPLDRAAFERLLPDQPGHARLVSLVRAFLGLETAFAINLVLAKEASFPARLETGSGSRLGWNCWMARSQQPARDLADALFDVP